MQLSKGIKVMLVDSHALARDALRVYLSTCPDIEVVGEAKSGEEALDLHAEVKPDVVLMEMALPGMDGATTTTWMKSRYPATKVIMLTCAIDADTVRRGLDAGASKYLFKEAPPSAVADVVREAYQSRA